MEIPDAICAGIACSEKRALRLELHPGVEPRLGNDVHAEHLGIERRHPLEVFDEEHRSVKRHIGSLQRLEILHEIVLLRRVQAK